MKIKNIETIFCNGGWRPWIFIKISTDEFITGYSEVTDSHGSPLGIKGAIENIRGSMIGRNPLEINKLSFEYWCNTRQTPGGLLQKVWAGIENALWDIKGKYYKVPIYDLFGGKIHDTMKVYWSHCGTTRVRAFNHVNKKQIRTYQDLKIFIDEVKSENYKYIKTNILDLSNDSPYIFMPGFNSPYGKFDRHLDKSMITKIEKLISIWRENTGEEFGIILDLNFNTSFESSIEILNKIEKYNLTWVEIDNFNPLILAKIAQNSSTPICTGENLYTTREFLPYFENLSMHISMVDLNWNGLLQAKKIADLSEAYDISIVPHNYYSHFSTFMNAQFCSMLPHCFIMEVDVDDVPWKDEIVTELPKIKSGTIEIPSGIGWGINLNEKEIKKHPWNFP